MAPTVAPVKPGFGGWTVSVGQDAAFGRKESIQKVPQLVSLGVVQRTVPVGVHGIESIVDSCSKVVVATTLVTAQRLISSLLRVKLRPSFEGWLTRVGGSGWAL